MLDFDDALEEIGEFGKFQIINYLLLCLPLFFSAGNSLTYVFTAGVPNYRCHVDACDDPTDAIYSEPWLKNAIPDSSSNGQYIPSQCSVYVPRDNLSLTCGETDDFFHNVTTKCDRWVFEDNERTIVGEWNITCLENQWKLSMVGTVHFLGILFGTILFGFLADRFGRKVIFVFCIVLMSLTGVAQAISSSYIIFQIFVFINALGTSGVYPLAFILGVELVGRRKREMSGVILNYFYAVGEASIGLIAWLSKDWVTVQLAVSVPPAIFIFYYWLVPESVRWLLAKKDTKKAAIIMKQAAKMNGVQLSSNLLNIMEAGVHADSKEASIEKEKTTTWAAVLELLRSRVLIIRSLLLFYIWSANAFIYYGLSVNSTTLGGNKYLNFSLVCLVEIPGYTISWLTMNKLGRRWSFAGSMMLCAITCLAAAFVPDDMSWAVILLFLLGKLGITMSFGVAYVYTAELYPTIIRSVGVGACSTVGRLGALVAPFAPLLSIYMKPLPLLLFGAVSFVAAIFTFGLPETLGTKLPDTVSEAEVLKLVPSATQSQRSSINEPTPKDGT